MLQILYSKKYNLEKLKGMKKMNFTEPLAYRVRPKKLEEYIGQEHILGKDKILYRTIKADRLSSIILWGPPRMWKNITCKSYKSNNKI